MGRILFMLTSTITLAGLSSLQSCHKCHDPKNPNCDDYDPCYGKHTQSAGFIVQESGYVQEPPAGYEPIPCDTLATHTIRFKVPEGNPNDCQYEWRIGTDTTKYTSKQFDLDFGDWVNKGNYWVPVTITLTVKRPYSRCLNSANDTLTKETRNIYFAPDAIDWAPSTFEGYYESDPKTTVRITRIKQWGGYFRGIPIGFTWAYFWVGLPTEDTCWPQGAIKGNYYYKGGKAESGTWNNSQLNGWMDYSEIYFINPDLVKATFRFKAPNNKNTYVFHGRRLK